MKNMNYIEALSLHGSISAVVECMKSVLHQLTVFQSTTRANADIAFNNSRTSTQEEDSKCYGAGAVYAYPHGYQQQPVRPGCAPMQPQPLMDTISQDEVDAVMACTMEIATLLNGAYAETMKTSNSVDVLNRGYVPPGKRNMFSTQGAPRGAMAAVARAPKMLAPMVIDFSTYSRDYAVRTLHFHNPIEMFTGTDDSLPAIVITTGHPPGSSFGRFYYSGGIEHTLTPIAFNSIKATVKKYRAGDRLNEVDDRPFKTLVMVEGIDVTEKVYEDLLDLCGANIMLNSTDELKDIPSIIEKQGILGNHVMFNVVHTRALMTSIEKYLYSVTTNKLAPIYVHIAAVSPDTVTTINKIDVGELVVKKAVSEEVFLGIPVSKKPVEQIFKHIYDNWSTGTVVLNTRDPIPRIKDLMIVSGEWDPKKFYLYRAQTMSYDRIEVLPNPTVNFDDTYPLKMTIADYHTLVSKHGATCVNDSHVVEKTHALVLKHGTTCVKDSHVVEQVSVTAPTIFTSEKNPEKVYFYDNTGTGIAKLIELVEDKKSIIVSDEPLTVTLSEFSELVSEYGFSRIFAGSLPDVLVKALPLTGKRLLIETDEESVDFGKLNAIGVYLYDASTKTARPLCKDMSQFQPEEPARQVRDVEGFLVTATESDLNSMAVLAGKFCIVQVLDKGDDLGASYFTYSQSKKAWELLLEDTVKGFMATGTIPEIVKHSKPVRASTANVSGLGSVQRVEDLLELHVKPGAVCVMQVLQTENLARQFYVFNHDTGEWYLLPKGLEWELKKSDEIKAVFRSAKNPVPGKGAVKRVSRSKKVSAKPTES